jgi:predicted O-methyltransferase YrrM
MKKKWGYNMSETLDLQGWFTEADGKCYNSIASRITGGRIIEIGTWKGLSTSYIGKACNKNHSPLWCVDTWLGTADDFTKDYSGYLQKEDIFSVFMNNMRLLGIDLTPVKMASLDAVSLFEDAFFDFIFLDASHDYENVKRDLDAWMPKLKRYGIFGGHDFHLHQSYFGLRKAVLEFTEREKLKLNLEPDSIWYFVKE